MMSPGPPDGPGPAVLRGGLLCRPAAAAACRPVRPVRLLLGPHRDVQDHLGARAPGPGTMSNVPPNSPSTSVRTICRPRLPARVRVEALGQADAVVLDGDQQPRSPWRLPPRTAETSTVPRSALAEAVLQGVLQDLGEHHRQRGGDLGVQDAEAAGAPAGHLARGDLRDHRQHPVGDLVELHPLVQVLGQRLVHDRDRTDPAYRLLERLPAPCRSRSAGPGAAAARRPSGGCSSPGGGSPGWSRPW